MKRYKITLNSIEDIKNFNRCISGFDVDFDIESGRFIIDAKSIMGLFSLDLSKPVVLVIHKDDDSEIIDRIMNIVKVERI